MILISFQWSPDPPVASNPAPDTAVQPSGVQSPSETPSHALSTAAPISVDVINSPSLPAASTFSNKSGSSYKKGVSPPSSGDSPSAYSSQKLRFKGPIALPSLTRKAKNGFVACFANVAESLLGFMLVPILSAGVRNIVPISTQQSQIQTLEQCEQVGSVCYSFVFIFLFSQKPLLITTVTIPFPISPVPVLFPITPASLCALGPSTTLILIFIFAVSEHSLVCPLFASNHQWLVQHW